jgi:hypothetical protein
MAPLDVFWKGEKMGVIVQPKIDNFHLYGAWVPVEGPKYANFIEAVQGHDEVAVQLGAEESDLHGTIEELSQYEIEVLMQST